MPEETKMTVQNLIDLLQELPDKDRVILTEGCDCWGYPSSIKTINSFSDQDIYLITREDGYSSYD